MSVIEYSPPAVVDRCAGVKPVRVGLLGLGQVGQAVARLIADEGDRRLLPLGLDLRIVAALVRDAGRDRRGPSIAVTTSVERFFERRPDVVIEALGGVHPAADLVRRALELGIPVVTANKSLMASQGGALRALAQARGVGLACEAAVVAGVPFLGALTRRPLLGSPQRIRGILNGTSHFVVCALTAGASFADALADAQARGYAEPDSAADVSGRDAAEKLTLLAHLAGCPDIAVSDLATVGIDALTPADLAGATALGGVIKPFAIASFHNQCGAWVGPALVDAAHPAAVLRGVANFVEVDGGHGMPVTFAGPGAGPDVTASTLVDDLVEVLSQGVVSPRGVGPARTIDRAHLRRPPAGAWFVRLGGADDLSVADVAEVLASHQAPAVRVARIVEGHAIVARTTSTSWATACGVADTFAAVGVEVLVLPVVDAGWSAGERDGQRT